MSDEINRLFNSILVGLARLCLPCCWRCSSAGARGPVLALSSVARLIGELRLEDIHDLPHSRCANWTSSPAPSTQ